jgi:YD repeat-containing protein
LLGYADVDARGAVTNYAYDALNRPISVTYPGDSAENVAFTYDEAGHGYGVHERLGHRRQPVHRFLCGKAARRGDQSPRAAWRSLR